MIICIYFGFVIFGLEKFNNIIGTLTEPQNLGVERFERMSSYIRDKRWTQSLETPSTRFSTSALAVLQIPSASNLMTLYATLPPLSLSFWVFIVLEILKHVNSNLFLSTQLSKSPHEVSKFASVALVDIDFDEIQVYVKYFGITFIPY